MKIIFYIMNTLVSFRRELHYLLPSLYVSSEIKELIEENALTHANLIYKTYVIQNKHYNLFYTSTNY